MDTKHKLSPKTQELYQAILKLESLEEAKRFFRDLLTEAEIEEFGNRWIAAQRLSDKVSYLKIAEETGLSSATIARISKWLTQGMGGYGAMINKIKKK